MYRARSSGESAFTSLPSASTRASNAVYSFCARFARSKSACSHSTPAARPSAAHSHKISESAASASALSFAAENCASEAESRAETASAVLFSQPPYSMRLHTFCALSSAGNPSGTSFTASENVS